MVLSINKNILNYYTPRYVGREIIIGIDSSKSNSALAIGDETGEVIDYIEIDGSKVGTQESDTLKLCYDQRKALSIIFKDAKIKLVGIENIISKEEKGKESGMTIHLSRFKITAVFMSFISFFQDEFGVTPQLVNNKTWKSVVLPEEFGKKIYDKGSLAYFKSIGSKYQYCSDDVTDAICILRYICIVNKISTGIRIIEPEASKYAYKYILINKERVVMHNEKRFIYNNGMTPEQNMIVMANQLTGKQFAVAEVSVEAFELDDIYVHIRGDFKPVEPILKLVVQRE